MSEPNKMEIMMQEMSEQMLAMQEFIKEQSLEIAALKKGSKGTMSATESVVSKGMLKEIEDTKKIAKEAVPKLTIVPDNFKIWGDKMKEVLKLMTNIQEFLMGVGLEEIQTIVKSEGTKKATAASLTTKPIVSEAEATNFFIFLTSRLSDDLAPLVEAANEQKTNCDQLKHLWRAIHQKFIPNSRPMRRAKQKEWNALSQGPDEDWLVWTQRVRRAYQEINDMFKVAKGAPKYDEEDYLSKLLEMNPHYTKLMNPTILAMEAQRQDYSMDEWLKALTALDDEDKRVNKGTDTGYANMARTTTPLPVQPGSTFRAVVNSTQAKQEWLCNNWNGEPGSCKYGQNCRFKHTNDKVERRAHLKKVQEWRAAQKTKVSESKQRKNDDKSAKKAAAQDQASSGSAAKDYVEIHWKKKRTFCLPIFIGSQIWDIFGTKCPFHDFIRFFGRNVLNMSLICPK